MSKCSCLFVYYALGIFAVVFPRQRGRWGTDSCRLRRQFSWLVRNYHREHGSRQEEKAGLHHQLGDWRVRLAVEVGVGCLSNKEKLDIKRLFLPFSLSSINSLSFCQPDCQGQELTCRLGVNKLMWHPPVQPFSYSSHGLPCPIGTKLSRRRKTPYV